MKVNHVKIKIGKPPFHYTNSEDAAPEKLAYAIKVGSGKIVKKSIAKKQVSGEKAIVATAATSGTIVHKRNGAANAGVANKRTARRAIKGKKNAALKKV